MDKTTKLKEALKFALAFALVYGIALKLNWMSPSWAGWSVVAIAATSGGGESLQKGMLRIWGTLLACLVGIAIISLGAQDRWLFMLLTASWVSFAGYQMLANKKLSYFWFVAAYVTLVITAAGPSSAGGFYIAVFRTMETILGIVVFTLIAVFIWPRTNTGAVKKAVGDLLDTQTKLLAGLYNVIVGSLQTDRLKELAQLQVKQLGQFQQSLKAEGSENYRFKELAPLWNQYDILNNSLLKSLDRLFGGIEDLSKTGNGHSTPELDIFFKEINNRFAEILSLLSGNAPAYKMQEVKLTVNSLAKPGISHFDKAALAIIISEFNNIEAISGKMLNIATKLADSSIADQKNEIRDVKKLKKQEFTIPVFDIEYLKGALYIFLTIVFGFIIWFYVNPPGHASWYIMGGVLALLIAGSQQIKTVKLILPFIIAMISASLIYIFVLPRLSNFYQLGILLFTIMFVLQYFLSGAATAIFTVAVIQLIAIDNPQTYDASSLLNGFVFIAMLMIYLFGMSYLIYSPRPEKAFLNLVSRFFKSAGYLVSQQAEGKTSASASIVRRYKTAFYLYELHNLAPKIKVWGKSINKKLFPNTDYQQIEEMANTLDVFVVRMETLLEANSSGQENQLIELSETIREWRKRLIKAFDSWDNLSEEEIKSNTSDLVLKKMNELEEKLKNIVAKNEGKIDEEESIQFYKLLGGYRGVTEATLSFVELADKLDWRQWKEERFQ